MFCGHAVRFETNSLKLKGNFLHINVTEADELNHFQETVLILHLTQCTIVSFNLGNMLNLIPLT